ncbi:histone acetyltransferase type B catalytic subunit [Octopus bimaculoides]|uniref:histone acetyltransferase type B catalytic subunit n=1 Tax=Octopus bimaculoides TaxID=37653 RepID=UPI0022E81E4A|nr:histone acetyltransferase type B catalytic subunit [Octopus bimaculoides]
MISICAPSGLMKNKLEAYKCCSNDVIHFKLVRNKKDVENEDITFRPDMTHQLFGDHESIFGYRDLHLDLFYTAGALITYLKIKYLDKVTPEKFDGISADDVEKPIAEMMPPGYLTNIDDFVSSLEKEHLFRPPGEKVNSYQIHKDNCERTFEVFKASVLSPGFKNYHERLQTFLLFFIDAASYIDIDDDRWTFYLLFEKYQQNGCVCYAVVGYMTVYNYYAYLEKIRPRIRYTGTCHFRGLLEDDSHWNATLDEAVVSGYAFQLLNLLAIMFLVCNISSPCQLWKKHQESFCADIVHRLQKENQSLEIQLTENIKNDALLILEYKVLQLGRKPFQEYGLPDPIRDQEILRETSYNINNLNVINLVEDPSENFQRLRDFVDVRNCMKLSSYKRENLSSGFCEKMSTEARTKLKLSKRQARRCYEILRLKSVNIHDEDEFRAYRLDVKKRLNLPFHKNGRDFKKLETILQPDELSATMPNLNAEQKYALLDKQFNETVQIYRHVIDRLECLAEP